MEKTEKSKVKDSIASRVINIKNLVEYQEGAVVSREIISEKTGTCTFFAFDKGQGLSEHTAPFDALVLCVEGEAEVTISGQPLQLHEGEMVIMPAHKPHALKAITKFKMLLVLIRT